MSKSQEIIKILNEKYTEEVMTEMVDEQMLEYVDTAQCEDEFDGDTFECYLETGNNAAESDVLNQIVRETGITPESDDWDALSEWFIGLGFSL